MKPNRERKSVGAEDTFAEDITALSDAQTLTGPLIEKVWCVCEQRGLFGRTVTLKIKFADFEQITRSRSAGSAVTCKTQLKMAVSGILSQNFPPQKPVRLLGVTVSNFDKAAAAELEQLSFSVLSE